MGITMKYFLVERDRSTRTPRYMELSDRDEALRLLNEKEKTRAPEMEVVLLVARTIEDLKGTHSRYFLTARESNDRLKGAYGLSA